MLQIYGKLSIYHIFVQHPSTRRERRFMPQNVNFKNYVLSAAVRPSQKNHTSLQFLINPQIYCCTLQFVFEVLPKKTFASSPVSCCSILTVVLVCRLLFSVSTCFYELYITGHFMI